MYAFLLIALLAAPLLFALRIYLLLPSRHRSGAGHTATPIRKDGETCSLGVFLGSGGHTAEMGALLSALDFKRYQPRVYVYCPGDEISLRVISELETASGSNAADYSFVQLPRARRVAEPPVSTIRSSILTLVVTLWHCLLKPLGRHPGEPWVDVLLVNGPGTCVLIVAVCWIRRFLGMSYTRIIYVESFARVKSLSLSGKLLRPFVDTFVVQWPDAAGPRDSATSSAGPSSGQKGSPSNTTYRGWLV